MGIFPFWEIASQLFQPSISNLMVPQIALISRKKVRSAARIRNRSLNEYDARSANEKARPFDMMSELADAISVESGLARRPRLPATMNPKPLVGIASYVIFDDARV